MREGASTAPPPSKVYKTPIQGWVGHWEAKETYYNCFGVLFNFRGGGESKLPVLGVTGGSKNYFLRLYTASRMSNS